MIPSNDEVFELQNSKLLLQKPDLSMVGDYVCRLKSPGPNEDTVKGEFAQISVRAEPFIEDFDIETSHTGRSSTINEGDRLELICKVNNEGTGPVNLTWLRSASMDMERSMFTPLYESQPSQQQLVAGSFVANEHPIQIEKLKDGSKRLLIESVGPEHRSYYVCVADNGITERVRKVIYIRVKDKLIALWPFLGIVAELFILFTIIYVWETRKAYKELRAGPSGSGGVGSTGGVGGGTNYEKFAGQNERLLKASSSNKEHRQSMAVKE